MSAQIIENHPESPCLRCNRNSDDCSNWRTCDRWRGFFRMKWNAIRRSVGVKAK